jgi:pimeloyl-ACP methyl ester carboxylesterase
MLQNVQLPGGKNIGYRSFGEGPAVVLLHGFGEDGTVWDAQVNHIPGYRLLVPDLPGTGNSDLLQDMTMEGMADAVFTLLETLTGKEPVTLVGHSMGGYITLAFAERYPQKLRSFGLFHSTAYADSEEKKATRRKGIEFIEQHGGPSFLKTTIPNLYSPTNRERLSYILQKHISLVHNFSDAALVSYYWSMMERPDRTAVLEGSRVPVLMVLGRHDTAVPLTDGLKQAHLSFLSYIHVLEESGHMGMWEEPERSNRILLDFINHTAKTTQPE